MNPYQGLKHQPSDSGNCGYRSNQHESLSGIETSSDSYWQSNLYKVLINMNPYQGLKQYLEWWAIAYTKVLINMNPYQGLKLQISASDGGIAGSNQHESLSGIETSCPTRTARRCLSVLINMNPYQGLKHRLANPLLQGWF